MRRFGRRPDPALRELEPDDRKLAQRMLAGDESAFEDFFGGNFPRLYRFAMARLKNPDLARDIAQSAICKAIAHLHTYRGEATLVAWLFTICQHEISAHYRDRQRIPPPVPLLTEDAEIRAVLDALPTSQAGPDEELRQKEIAQLVHATLDALPPRYARALEWKYLDGEPVAEIATRLEVGVKAAESLLTRAREAFREGFAALGEPLGRARVRSA